MRIVYVAKHHSGGNDDEGAINHALECLGHEVIRIGEAVGHKALSYKPDLVLFHKWMDLDTLKAIKCPKVFWYFDLVDFPDRLLRPRCRNRILWMANIVPLVDLGFCTDGDWVAADTKGKLVWLPQGADERVLGPGNPMPHRTNLLFTGIKSGGVGREFWVKDMMDRYGGQFTHINSGLYGRNLADWIASSSILLCPDAPVTDRYWSNRVYNAAGFGAFILHPYCANLVDHYKGGVEIMYYHNPGQLHYLIETMLKCPNTIMDVGMAALARTKAEHTYTHRCKKLIEIVKERLRI